MPVSVSIKVEFTQVVYMMTLLTGIMRDLLVSLSMLGSLMILTTLQSQPLLTPTTHMVVGSSTPTGNSRRKGYTDLATYYTGKGRDLGRGAAERARMAAENAKLRQEACFSWLQLRWSGWASPCVWRCPTYTRGA